ncbi:hypothetical protein H6G33_22015 [Calothrix sp. FACHB-1219]|uniref:hypothetical protein n=1 Tax=unclassified Calothrix TaxID=2619626 RepID=UPI0016899D22|nr:MULTISPECIES: hypothetical protein [unclassified Calothrix]MBD2206707.1 hypothetical protein [Calothrix sp. FACHB-168]MBD2219697.1 hypothetical protein [Calothrix sp. FACHB-1219]
MNQQKAIAVGFQRHIVKPIAPRAVVALVIELVHQNEKLYRQGFIASLTTD